MDGKEFQTVRTADGKTIDPVWSITEDPHGNLWFGNQGNGIRRYDASGFITFDRETEFLNSYLRLEQMRFPGKFRFEIIRHNVPPAAGSGFPP